MFYASVFEMKAKAPTFFITEKVGARERDAGVYSGYWCISY
jgi:hypothetical protein